MMRKAITCSIVLYVILILMILPTSVEAADDIKDVSTVEELRAALEDNAGAHVRLMKDITFTRANAADKDIGVYLGEGCYTIDLNGYTIKYHYMTGGEFTDQGSPLGNRNGRLLIINGPGSIIGGTHGLEHHSQFGTLIINGGTIRGIMGNGIIGGGILYINGGTITGNFGGIEYDRAIIVLNGGEVKSVVYKTWDKKKEKNNGVIRNGVFTGQAVLEKIVLDVPNLTISEGSSIKVIRDGGFIVRDNFVNKGIYTYESGLKSIGGEATVQRNQQDYTPISILFDVTFNSLDIQRDAALYIENGATVTVTGNFTSDWRSSIEAENGSLQLLGNIDHKGRSVGVPVLAALEEGGISPLPEERDFINETQAVYRLWELGLFQGVGTYPDGGINFDLARKPSRIEALVMLIRLLGKENEAKNSDWIHPFTDVPEWADKYVGYAYEKGLTKGSSGSEFGTGTASVQMYLTFVLRALGYSDAPGGDFTWDAPERFAQGIRVLPEGVYMEDFCRADMVLISEAALSVKLKDSRDTLLDRLIEDGAVMRP
ncbi:hypothetical protein [Lutispora sp.]|uniref:hypothetical protein n=1 Tax=Lutispora sp. TaxID=2828727 RepID=UPI003566A8C9